MALPRLTPLSAALVTAFAAFLWGTSFPVNHLGLQATDPGTFAVARFVVASAVSVVVALALGRFDVRLFRRPAVWGLAALNAAGFLFQFIGQGLTTPAKAALLVNANALVVVMLAFFMLRERPTKNLWAALAIALVGVFFLTTGGDLAALREGSALGDLFAFLAGATWSLWIVLTKRLLDDGPGKVDAVGLVTVTFVSTAVLLLPLGYIGWPDRFLVVPTEALWPILYVGAVCAALANLIWIAALKRLTAGVSATILLFEVPVAASFSVGMGLEDLSLAEAAGGLLLFLAIAWVTLADARRSA